jgi:hypothetical protein
MYVDQIGYRHNDGGIRGYVGYGFSAESARDNSLDQIRLKCKASGECVENDRIIVTKKECRKGEDMVLRTQWKAIRKASKNAGASIY